MDNTKICTSCGIIEDVSLFGKKSSKCKKCLNEICRQNRLKNGEFYKIANKKYVLKNRERIRERQREYNRKRKQEDTLYKLKCNLRTLIRVSFKNKNLSKNSKTCDILGCDYDFFRIYIEAQFTENMNWNNIHLDHIKPLFYANTEKELLELNHYTNFQPLLAKDNLCKNNKLIAKQLKLL